MANMGYCRFQNTATDLADCEGHIRDPLDGAEAESRAELLMSAFRIVDAVLGLIEDESDMEAALDRLPVSGEAG